MKLRARLHPLGPGAHEVLASYLPREALIFQSARCPVDVGDPVLPRIFEAGDKTEGFWVSGESTFTADELREVTHYELVCRSIVRESDRDFQENDAARERTLLMDAGGESPIRLMSGLSLSRIPLKPNMVGSVGDWTQEYVLGAAVAQAFTKARFTGYSLMPVRNPKTGGHHDGYSQLYSDAVLPPAVVDASVERLTRGAPSEVGQLRHLGCLAYKFPTLNGRPDFNRTAEPWGGWHGWPSWVVSARVEKTFKKGKLRGWHFRPVLYAGSALYSEYLAAWTELRARVEAAAKSQMDGGRW